MFYLKQKINEIWKNRNGKILISNFGYLSILQVVSYVFPIITIPYLARVIGVDSFGKIAFAAAVIEWFNTMVDWGFNYTATRDVVRSRKNKEQVSVIFSNVFWARCFLMIVATALLLTAIILIPVFNDNKTILLITFLSVPCRIMFPEWFFQAMERMKYITLFNLLSKVLSTIAVFVFINERSDFILYPLFASLGFFSSGSVAMYLIIGKWDVKFHPPHFPSIIKTIKGSTDIFINNIMPNFYNGFSTILLGFYGGSISNGILDAGNKFPRISHRLLEVISRTFYPFLSRRIDKHDLYAKIHISVSLFATLILFFFAPLFIKLFFTVEFCDAISVLRITSLSVFFISLNNVYGVNFLLIEGYENKLRNITIICSLLGLLSSFPFVYYLDFIGAAINVTLVQFVSGFSMMITVKKIIKSDKKL